MATAKLAALDLISFINASPSPFHAIAECARRLENNGFFRLSERDSAWACVPGGKYYVTRGQSALVAFAVGGRFSPGNGFTIAAGHSDSPCLRVKPVSSLVKGGALSLGVETYGGGIWHTWFDRDLSLAGRVVVERTDGGAESRLVRIERPLCRVPTLAIHLDREVNSKFAVNAEAHLPPLLASAVEAALRDPPQKEGGGGGRGVGPAGARHHAGVVRVLAEALGVEPTAVRDFELSLYDVQPSALGGLYEEYI
jgi:aspartyl aminopeptidase